MCNARLVTSAVGMRYCVRTADWERDALCVNSVYCY
jgi:hypothetical protein